MGKNNNTIKKKRTIEREYQLDDLLYIISNYNLIALSGEFGIGKTFLKDELLEDRTFKAKYLDIQVNAYNDSQDLLNLFFKKIILKNNLRNKKIKPFCYKYFFHNPNINNWFGKFILNFSKTLSIILTIFSPTLIISVITFRYENKISSTVMWILVGIIISVWVLLLITNFISFCRLKRNEIENLSKLERKKYHIFKKRNKEIIFLIEDLNRLDSLKQKEFLQSFLSYKEKIDPHNNIKCLFLADIDFEENHDWTKYFDFNFSITNLYETMASIFAYELEKTGIEWKLIVPNMDIQIKIESILNLIFKNKNIRLLELFIKNLKMYKNLIINNDYFKINIVDLFSYIYLSVYEKEIFLYINNNPNIICSNNCEIIEDSQEKDKWFGKKYNSEWTKLISWIQDKDPKKPQIINYYGYEHIREDLLPLTAGILRFQTKKYWSIKKELERNFEINITEEEYFYFYKSSQHYKKFIQIYNQFIENKKLNNNPKIWNIIRYGDFCFNSNVAFFGLKTFQIFAKLIFSFYKNNNDSNGLYNNFKNEILSFAHIEQKSFSFDTSKISQISLPFKQIFKNEISADIDVLIKKYNLPSYPEDFLNEKKNKGINDILNIIDKPIDFVFNIEDEINEKDFKWLILLSNIFFTEELGEFKSNFIIDKISFKDLQIYNLFYIYNFFDPQKNYKIKEQVKNIISYERKKNKLNDVDFIYELMLYDIFYPCRFFVYFSEDKLKILSFILNSKDQKSSLITRIVINSHSNSYKFYFDDLDNEKSFWKNEEDIFNDMKKNDNEFCYWLIKNHKNKFKEFLIM